MKRILLILVACSLCVSLWACGSKPSRNVSTAVSLPDANFNNQFWISTPFWAFDDHIFYQQDGFYNMGTYWSNHGNKVKLFEERDFRLDPTVSAYINDVFVCHNYLYFIVSSEQEDTLYCYDLNEAAYAPVCKTPNLYRWVVVDDHFIYREHPANSDERKSPLFFHDLKDGTTTQVCDHVEEFGVVNGELRYITYGESYELHRYKITDKHSSILGTFGCAFDRKYDLFNFTPQGLVMYNWNGEQDRELVVYTISSNSTAVYSFPKALHYMVAYDHYAYAVIYDTEDTSSDAVASEENGIYRISLKDGSYERIEQGSDHNTRIHVVSDDCIYIIQGTFGLLSRYRNHVYKYDYITGNKEKILTY